MTSSICAATLVVVAALASSGCRERGDSPPELAPAAGASAAATGDHYTVRGEIVRLPAAGAPEKELSIRHEAIPDFKDRSGKRVGMSPMMMPFPVGKDVSLGGLEVGDKVRFRFLMDWAGNGFVIESLEELPKETVLDFADRTP